MNTVSPKSLSPKSPLTVVLVAFIALQVSCMPIYVNGYGSTVPISLTPPSVANYTVVHRFRRHERAWYILWGLIPLGKPNIGRITSDAATMGDAVVNLSVTDRIDFLDALFTYLLGFGTSIIPRSVIIEGDVIRYAPDAPRGPSH